VATPAVDGALFLLLAAMWGGSFVAIKYAVAAYPPVFSALLRVAIALAALWAIFAVQGRALAAPAPLRRRMWAAGFFAMGLPFALLFWGETRISPGLAGILNGTVPLWTFVFGLALGEESFTRRRALGLALGFLGIAVICLPVVRFGGTSGELAGVAAVTAMAISYGIGTRLTKRILSAEGVDFRVNAFHQHIGGLATLIVASAYLERWPPVAAVVASPAALGASLYMGVFSTALAFLIYYRLIRDWGAVRASAVTYIAPIFALFWDFVFFRNLPRPAELIGVAIVLSGVAILNAPARK
jgi:drug/metabolite transporter (DMT)-like permease